MSSITLRNIHKSFGETHALVGASLETSLGEIHAIVGENGSGKSTLAKIISGVIAPDSGEVNILGGSPKNPIEAIRSGIATIYQEMMLADDLSVYENVYSGVDGLLKNRVSTSDKRRGTKSILERLTLTKIDPDQAVGSLPLAIKQWVVIARALIQKPKILIFDESSAALDLEATNRLHVEMNRLKEGGTCVVLVTHRIAELVKIADSATVLRDGATVGRLSKNKITEANLLELMSASTTAINSVAERRVLTTAQIPVLAAKQVQIHENTDPVDFRLDAGEIVGIAGLDGAGHADFARILAGIQNPNAGEVSVGNNAKTRKIIKSLSDAEANGITYVSGDRKRVGIFPNLSIDENFGMALMDKSPSKVMVDRFSLHRLFDLEIDRLKIKFGKRADKITTLSGGNQQKVLIARAFAKNPKVIILNDPARGVDIGTKQELYRQLRKLASNGVSIVYLSSEIEEFYGFVDRADVFFGSRLFGTFSGADINEDKILSAMFGHREHVEFDDTPTTQNHERSGH